MSLDIKPVITARLEYRKASSDCCGAKLTIASGGGFACLACGKQCEKVMGPPAEVTARG